MSRAVCLNSSESHANFRIHFTIKKSLILGTEKILPLLQIEKTHLKKKKSVIRLYSFELSSIRINMVIL